MILKRKSNFPIGLDISDSSIKIIQLKKQRDGIKIQSLGKTKLETGLIENGEIKNEDAVVEKINQLISQPKFGTITSNEVVASLPDSQSFTRLIDIEKTPNSLNDVMEAELEKYIPYPVSSVYYDWQKISETDFNYQILVGATPQNIVDSYTSLLRKAKLSILGLEIESTSISRCLLQEESPSFKKNEAKSYAIIDIGENKTNMLVYSNNSIIFSLSLPISSRLATEKIAKTLDIEIEKAEKAKILCGLDKKNANGVISEILSENLNDLLKKIHEIIEYFNHQFNFNPITEIILTGGGANLKQLDNIIESKTKIKTTVGNIFININENQENFANIFKDASKTNNKNTAKNKTETDESQGSFICYATSVGLSLRSFFINNF